MRKTIFWVAAEKSADIHASVIISRLPQFDHIGVGGKKMVDVGLKPKMPFEKFAVMGVIDVVKKALFFRLVLKKIKTIFQSGTIDLVVLVDYPGLNLKIAALAKKQRIKVVYYILPKVWAWNERRAFKLNRLCDKLLCIFPFEVDFYRELGIEATFVGNPIKDEITIKKTRSQFAKENRLDIKKRWIGLFPGSRNSEVKKLMPIFLKLAKSLDSEIFEVIVSKSDSVDKNLFPPANNSFIYISNSNYEIMKYSFFLFIKSGTATLEAAIVGTPFAICYKTDWLFYLLARRFINIGFIGLPNIIANKSVVKEYIQKNFTAQNLHNYLLQVCADRKKYQRLSKDIQAVSKLLDTKNREISAETEIKKLAMRDS